jgi:hypothetical protein
MPNATGKPRFNLDRIAAFRDEILTQFLTPFIGSTPEGATVDAMASAVAAAMSVTTTAAALDTIRAMPRRVLTETHLYNLAWRLAGNAASFRAGRPARAWTTQVADEWVPLEILRAVDKRDDRDRLVVTYTLRVWAGTACPRLISVVWTRPQVLMVARRIGFTKRTGRFPYLEASQLVGLHLLGKCEVGLSERKPVFQEVDIAPSTLKRNQDLLKMRILRQPPCPARLAILCHRCAHGADVCPAATHPVSYESRHCPRCESQAFWDPADDTSLCVTCARTERCQSLIQERPG